MARRKASVDLDSTEPAHYNTRSRKRNDQQTEDTENTQATQVDGLSDDGSQGQVAIYQDEDAVDLAYTGPGNPSDDDTISDGHGSSDDDDENRATFSQSQSVVGRDPYVLLRDLSNVNIEAGRLINFFLKEFQDGDKPRHSIEKRDLIHDELKTAMVPYPYNGLLLDPRRIAEVLGIGHQLDPIFWKANLAILSYAVCEEDTDQAYHYLGGREVDFRTSGGYAPMGDDDNYRLIVAFRTQLYILSITDAQGVPDATGLLLGTFCHGVEGGGDGRVGRFEDRLQTASLKGWQAGEGPVENTLPSKYHERMLEHIAHLHDLTTADGESPQTSALIEVYPYAAFQEIFLDWLKKAFRKLNTLQPPIDQLINTADEGKDDLAAFRQEIQALYPEPRPKAHDLRADTRKTSRHHRHSMPNLGDGFPADTRLDPSVIAGIRTLSSQIPRQHQPQEETPDETGDEQTDSSDQGVGLRRSSGPPDFRNFDINKLLKESAEAKRMGNKENKAVKKRYNQSQADAQKETFDIDVELGADVNDEGPERSRTLINVEPDDVAEAEDLPDTQVAQKRKRTASGETDDDDSDEYEEMVNRSPKKPRIAKAAARPNKRIREYENAGRATAPRPPSQESRSTVQGLPPFRPSTRTRAGRREWSDEDRDMLIEAITEVGPQWAAIRDGYFGGRWSDVDCKDKARNIKADLLKRLQPLPKGFEWVTLGKKIMDQLARMGILYTDGESAATLLRH